MDNEAKTEGWRKNVSFHTILQRGEEAKVFLVSGPKGTDRASISNHSVLANNHLVSSLSLNKENNQNCENVVPELLQCNCHQNQGKKGDFYNWQPMKTQLRVSSILILSSSKCSFQKDYCFTLHGFHKNDSAFNIFCYFGHIFGMSFPSTCLSKSKNTRTKKAIKTNMVQL